MMSFFPMNTNVLNKNTRIVYKFIISNQYLNQKYLKKILILGEASMKNNGKEIV